MTQPTEVVLLQEELTRSAIGCFFAVHRELGFGFREFIYKRALERELVARGHQVAREVATMVYYRGEPIARQTIDTVVDNLLVIEVKSSERLQPGSREQLMSYLCATTLEVGLLFHFGRVPKFARVIYENRLKGHSLIVRETDTGLTEPLNSGG